jgi:nitroimidazol reductase NimA-like FMN-containing flavoprotein (pyridoxamine 5'-phosphate oxidase superfamily)
MDRKTKTFILGLLRDHNIMSLATVRPDGYPQATTVAYANDGLTLYFACDRSSQEVRNIEKCRKVSLTIDRDCADWSKIKGLSMAATARALSAPAAVRDALKRLGRKFPGMGEMSEEDLAATAVVEVVPKVISVIDYRKGFGHTRLVKV